MPIRPLHDRVLVRPAPADQVTKSGIILPDVAQERPLRGEVVAVGLGKTSEDGFLIDPVLKVGDVVIYGKYGGAQVDTDDGEALLMMRESDILGVIETEDAED